MFKYSKLQSITVMPENSSQDNQQVPNLEWFGEYIQSYKIKGNAEKIKLAEKIFLETYFANIQEGMNPKVALQKAITVSFCFLIESQI